MSGNDMRDELADIAHHLRRLVEREARAGRGELLARAAKPAANGARGKPKRTVTAPPAAPVEPATTKEAPGATVLREGRAATALQQKPAVRPVSQRAIAEAEAGPLHPAGIEERQRIATQAKPLLAAIAGEVNQCKACALWETRTRAVPGVGSALSGVVFVGEAPGAEEDRLGEPFVGRAGQLLDKIIKAMDEANLIPGVPLSRETVFIGNVIHCRPPDNRVPLPIEVTNSSPFLTRQLQALKPRIICCLGKTAAEHLLGAKATLASMRGRVYRIQGAKMIVTYHPAAVLRNPEWKRPVWEDMQLLAREYQTD
jgi:DNA polymerase